MLIYRASGVINFAQGQIGAFGALLMAAAQLQLRRLRTGWASRSPSSAGAALGGITELLVVRRLFYQPRLLLFVATLGVSQVILLPDVPTAGASSSRCQLPDADRGHRWEVGPVNVRGDQLWC